MNTQTTNSATKATENTPGIVEDASATVVDVPGTVENVAPGTAEDAPTTVENTPRTVENTPPGTVDDSTEINENG